MDAQRQPLNVTLDVDFVAAQNGGIGRYAVELARGLTRHPDVRLGTWARGVIIPDYTRLLSGEQFGAGNRFVRPFRRWRDRQRAHATLFHGPNYFLPAFVERGVITVHDLSVLRFPETHPAARVAEFQRRLPDSLARALFVITDTETVRQEIIEEFALEPERVKAVPLGVEEGFRPQDANALAPVLTQWDLSAGQYGLSVSQLEPRKKIAELVRAWRALPKPLRGRFPLVIAGDSGWRNDDIRRELQQAEAEGWLKVLGYVPDEQLPALYAGARLFAYPSVYEGFGLPPLEAMACGVPVVVSSHSCLPEVAGEAAMYVDPDHQPSFTDALRKGLEDEEWRGVTIERGLARAAGFTWEATVEGTVNVYREALRLA